MKNLDTVYPFTAIVGQERMRLALILNAINPLLSGVLIRGEKGTAKSTAVRALADLLPELDIVADCPFRCDPSDTTQMCDDCRERVNQGETLPVLRRPMAVIELPLSATEDRVVGTIDLEKAIKLGERHFEPGILAEANRNLLYVDEVNLLDDHVVDVLLDSAAMGVNTVEREGISFSHPARFILVGTMNPEEGELRPQLLDRFGLCVPVTGIPDVYARMEVVRRRSTYDEDPEEFAQVWEDENRDLRERIVNARALMSQVSLSDEILEQLVRLVLEIGVDGHRADLVMVKAAKTSAAYRGREGVELSDIQTAAQLALPHRVRRRPFQEIDFDLKKVKELLMPA
jgi:Mg-chelatase subunit ChlI